MKRADVLDAARLAVCTDREHSYGKPEDNFRAIARLWMVYLAAAHPEVPLPVELTPKDVAIMMALLKVARIATGKSDDSYVDLAGYATCAAETDNKGEG